MKYSINPALSTRKIDNEVFIYDRNRSLIHTFNETATVLWDDLVRGAGTEEMVNHLTDEFDVDTVEAAADVTSFFATLHALAIVTDVQ